MTSQTEEVHALIQRNTVPTELPSVPEIRLHLVTDQTPLWRATDADLERKGLSSPFWAFAWAGGQALARYILDHPDKVVGKRVLDFATGSGVVAIAAMKAGAAMARAADIDAVSIEAVKLNAALNAVSVDTVLGDVIDDPCADIDIVVAGDVFYDRDIAKRGMAWFRSLAARGVLVMVGDPGRYHFPKASFKALGHYALPTRSDIEDEGVTQASVYAILQPSRR